MSSAFFQVISLYQAHRLTHSLIAEEETKTQKIAAAFVAELFFIKVYQHLSTSSLIEAGTNKLIFGAVTLIPLAKLAAMQLHPGSEEEKIATHLLRIASYVLYIGLMVHAIASLVASREAKSLLIFAPFLIAKGCNKLPPLSIQTERKVVWLKEAFLNLNLFYPLSPVYGYYISELFLITFLGKPTGPYTSYLTENYIEGLKACEKSKLNATDYLTPAYFAVIYEVECGKRHPDVDRYPKRTAKLDELRGVNLDGVKQELLQGKYGSDLAKQVHALTGIYTGNPTDCLDKENGHCSLIHSDRRVASYF